MRRQIVVTAAFVAVFLFLTSTAIAQEQRHEVSVQGTGSFTKNSEGNGVSQHTTDSGGLLANYRFHITPWLAAEANYGYNRNTHQNFTLSGPFAVNANTHQTTGALVFSVPSSPAGIEPYVLAGGGAMVFDPRSGVIGTIGGTEQETKAAFLYGGGANIRLLQHVSLRLEYRGLVYKRPDFGLSSLNSGATAHTALPTLGIAFRF
jgi:outer membrane immunogenic protein